MDKEDNLRFPFITLNFDIKLRMR